MRLDRIALSGQGKRVALDFEPGANLVYGASNTGKSFAVKSIDFMLGGQRQLPDIAERRPYEQVLLTLTLPMSGQLTLVRSIRGGAFSVVDGISDEIPSGSNRRLLSARHDPSSLDNLSNLLLTELGLAGRQIVTDVSGKKRSLSFRDLAHLCAVVQTSIQSDGWPIENGTHF